MLEFGQVQQCVLGGRHLVPPRKLVDLEWIKGPGAVGWGRQKAKVHVLEFEAEVAHLGGQMPGPEVERWVAPNPDVGVENRGTQGLGDTLSAAVGKPSVGQIVRV